MLNTFAFVSYVVVNTFTPGPNNIMSMSNASRYGFRRALRFTAGVGAGFFLLVGIAITCTVALYNFIPMVKPYMTIAGASYIVWLAWKTVTSSSHESDNANECSFTSGMLLQFLNPKAILYSITAASTFIVPYFSSVPKLIGFSAALALVSVAATSLWALFGSVFRRFMADNRRLVGWVMGGLLIYCAVSLFL
jgi:threonine/homoserine/homoserine lactone efflux protein